MPGEKTFDDELIEIYTLLWKYKDLLKGSPVLEVDPKTVNETTKGSLVPRIKEQTSAVIAYLLGLHSPMNISSMSNAIEKYYQKDDFWRKLLIRYMQMVHEEELFEFNKEKKAVCEQVATLKQKVSSYREERKDIIKSFAEAVQKEKFPVNAKKLFTNYLNMADKNPQEAWNTLITNPAFFSPIITVDASGKVVLSPSAAKAQNEKLANFLKKLKA